MNPNQIKNYLQLRWDLLEESNSFSYSPPISRSSYSSKTSWGDIEEVNKK